MAEVTGLRPSGRRFAIEIDGAGAGLGSEALIARWRLYRGRCLSDDEAAALQHEIAVEAAYGDAARALAQRARSRAELQSRLRARKHDAAVVAAVIDKLDDEGLIDDASFTRAYVADKRGLAGWGGERIRRGLVGLGVEADLIAAALGGDGPGHEEHDEVDRAVELLRRRGAPRPPLEAARRRAYHLLLRRGFSAGDAYAAIKVWAAGSGDDSQI